MCVWLSNIQIQNPYKAMYTIQYIYIPVVPHKAVAEVSE